MPRNYAAIAFTDHVKAEQERYGSRRANARAETSPRVDDELGPEEIAFLEARDTFYLATVGEGGWPYVQLRGGPPGFLHALDSKTLAYADFGGNTQLITVGNAQGDDRAAIIAVDEAARERIKLFVRLEIKSAADDLDLAKRLTHPTYHARVERIVLMHLAAFDWNCQQHITPRYTEAEILDLTAPLRDRIDALQRENATLREHSTATDPSR